MDIAEGVLLSSWNCVLGPKVECLWLPNSDPEFNLHESGSSCSSEYPSTHSIPSNDFCKYVAGGCEQEMHGSLCTNRAICLDSSSNVQNPMLTSKVRKVLKVCGQLLVGEAEQNQFLQSKSRLFLSEDSHLVITSVLFHKVPCLSLQKSRDKEGVWYCLALFFDFSKLKAILDIRYMIDLHLRKAADAIKNIPDPLSSSSKGVSCIMQDLFSSVNMLAGCNQGSDQVSITELGNSAENLEFISKAVSSHLQTFCISVIIGSSEYLVKQVIHLLMMFCNEKEKYSFQRSDKRCSLSYIDGINVQGFVADINQAVDMLSRIEMYENPVTVVDTVNQVVQKFHITKGDCVEDNRCSLEIVTDSGLLIPEGFEKVLLLVKNGESPVSTVNELSKLFKLKATALLKIVRKSRAFGIPSKSELMAILGLREVADLQIILGCAEKLRPGISSLIR